MRVPFFHGEESRYESRAVRFGRLRGRLPRCRPSRKYRFSSSLSTSGQDPTADRPASKSSRLGARGRRGRPHFTASMASPMPSLISSPPRPLRLSGTGANNRYKSWLPGLPPGAQRIVALLRGFARTLPGADCRTSV
jgi:hypothetical protein